MLKRGLSATIQEFLMAAEYILKQGNYNVILCERGIRTFETMTRNTLDLGSIPLIKRLTHLPIIVDPSHGTGDRASVPALARAAVALGADGLMVEVHPHPEKALSDGPQSLDAGAVRHADGVGARHRAGRRNGALTVTADAESPRQRRRRSTARRALARGRCC